MKGYTCKWVWFPLSFNLVKRVREVSQRELHCRYVTFISVYEMKIKILIINKNPRPQVNIYIQYLLICAFYHVSAWQTNLPSWVKLPLGLLLQRHFSSITWMTSMALSVILYFRWLLCCGLQLWAAIEHSSTEFNWTPATCWRFQQDTIWTHSGPLSQHLHARRRGEIRPYNICLLLWDFPSCEFLTQVFLFMFF